MRGNFSGNATDSASVAKKDGLLCKVQELLVRWCDHCQEQLNHKSATTCYELDSAAAATMPDSNPLEKAPSFEEVRTAIGKLHNGWADGLDDISLELLKCAKDRSVLHSIPCSQRSESQASE